MPKSVLLRVRTREVFVHGASSPLPEGDYEGHVDFLPDGSIGPTQIIVPDEIIANLAATRPLTSMDFEVLRFIQSGHIEATI